MIGAAAAATTAAPAIYPNDIDELTMMRYTCIDTSIWIRYAFQSMLPNIHEHTHIRKGERKNAIETKAFDQQINFSHSSRQRYVRVFNIYWVWRTVRWGYCIDFVFCFKSYTVTVSLSALDKIQHPRCADYEYGLDCVIKFHGTESIC